MSEWWPASKAEYLRTMRLSVIIPTLGREQVLLDTITALLGQLPGDGEIVVIDQTREHLPHTERELQQWAGAGTIQWLRPAFQSIPRAMNAGICAARGDTLIFVDDDVIPAPGFLEAHCEACMAGPRRIHAGRVLQPWHCDGSRPLEGLAGREPGVIEEFIGCNFSVARAFALELGGFDERFVQVAYRFEADFAERARRSGGEVYFLPQAELRHLRAGAGGTRSYGDHLRTFMPAHAVGEYYFLLVNRPSRWWGRLARRWMRAPMTRHHLRRPWWILPTVVSESSGLLWAVGLWLSGRRLLSRD